MDKLYLFFIFVCCLNYKSSTDSKCRSLKNECFTSFPFILKNDEIVELLLSAPSSSSLLEHNYHKIFSY